MSSDSVEKVAGLLNHVGEVHHLVYSDTDGEDDDWASYYSDWLLSHGKLGELLGHRPIRSHLTRDLVNLNDEYTKQKIEENWPAWYAERLASQYGVRA